MSRLCLLQIKPITFILFPVWVLFLADPGCRELQMKLIMNSTTSERDLEAKKTAAATSDHILGPAYIQTNY